MLREETIQDIAEPDVREICQPLFNATDISYFHHGRVYKDGTACSLNTSPRWFDCYIEEGYHQKANYFLDAGVYLLTAMPAYAAECASLRSQFGVDHKFDIIVKKDTHLDIFGFGADAHNDSIVEFYFNNLDLLKGFSEYFLDVAEPLINKALLPENRLFLPELKKNFANANTIEGAT